MSPFVYFATSNVIFMFDGELAEARVTASPTIVRTKFATRYSYPVEYRDATGIAHLGTALLADATVSIGDAIPLRYLRSDPTRSRTEAGLWNSWPVLVFATIACFTFASSTYAGIKGWRDVRKDMRADGVF